jgi:hypothetical protein
MSQSDLNTLSTGPLYPFRGWPNDDIVPNSAAGVYTIWHNDGRFIYVGMSGRGTPVPRETPWGLHTRLKSHANGRRSGDQFCVYVADRFVLPTLSQEDITEIAAGRHQMDALVRTYIHENLSYRFVTLTDGTAYALETAIRSGGWGHGKPFLNPGK